MDSGEELKIVRPSDCTFVIKQDYQFLLSSKSSHNPNSFSPLSEIILTFINSKSERTQIEIRISENRLIYELKFEDRSTIEEAERPARMNCGLPNSIADAKNQLISQIWVSLNRGLNTLKVFVGDITPAKNPLF